MRGIKIHWTPFALACLDGIYDSISEEAKSYIPARKIVEKIIKHTDKLSRFPESGQKESLLRAIGQNSRYLVALNYKIIYEYYSNEQVIIITDIFHTSQNPKKLIINK
jgi:plasmid stabilization system protein ParE